ncbi:MAG: hypothetical protein AAFZ15_05890 [Bacteroidota bacterium]
MMRKISMPSAVTCSSFRVSCGRARAQTRATNASARSSGNHFCNNAFHEPILFTDWRVGMVRLA